MTTTHAQAFDALGRYLVTARHRAPEELPPTESFPGPPTAPTPVPGRGPTTVPLPAQPPR